MMEQKKKLSWYSPCAMLLLMPMTVHAQGAKDNALEALSGKTAGVNVTTNGLDRMAMLNSVRVRGTTSIMGGNDPLVIIDGVTSDVATLLPSILPTSRVSPS